MEFAAPVKETGGRAVLREAGGGAVGKGGQLQGLVFAGAQLAIDLFGLVPEYPPHRLWCVFRSGELFDEPCEKGDGLLVFAAQGDVPEHLIEAPGFYRQSQDFGPDLFGLGPGHGIGDIGDIVFEISAGRILNYCFEQSFQGFRSLFEFSLTLSNAEKIAIGLA